MMRSIARFFKENLVLFVGSVAFVAIGLSLMVTLVLSKNFLTQEIVKASEESNFTITQVFVNELYPKIKDVLKLEQHTHTEPLSSSDYQLIDKEIREFVQGTNLLKANIFTATGRTLYSTDYSRLWEDYSQRPGFQLALQGQTSSEHSFRESFISLDGEVFERDLVSSYIPVTINGQIVGAVELYSDRSISVKRAKEVHQKLIYSLTPIALLVFLSLLTAVWYLDGQRRLQNNALDESNNALQEAIAKEVQANEAKSSFLAMMSHEIRTPLNGVIATLSLIDLKTLSKENQELIETSLHSSELLTSVINDILDYSKIQANKFVLNHKIVHAQALVDQVEKTYRNMIEDKGLEFVVEAKDLQSHFFWADPVRIKQILNNYLNNAFKFTEHGRITLHSHIEPSGEWYLGVSDSGIGIDKQGQKHLFEEFSQVESGHNRSHGGSGLGLAISKKLAELMHGSVGVESELGRGSTFWVKLNLEARSVAQAEQEQSAQFEHPVDFDKVYKVLIVEDNAVNQLIAQKLLKIIGFEYAVAHNGQECLDYLSEHAVDVILMDCQMPVMDGYEATRQLRALGNQTPIIALTANAQESDRQLCLSTGMDDFLSKPFKKEQLQEVLYRTLQESSS